MNFKNIALLIFLLFFKNAFSQERIMKKYNNGVIMYEGFVVNKALDSLYKEYYPNGVLKTEGFYKDCKYKTNAKSIIVVGCFSGQERDSIQTGTLNGEWKNYYESGKLESTSNYFCGIQQGNFYRYLENGSVETIDFYNGGKLYTSQTFNKNQTLEEISYFDENWKNNKKYKTTRTISFYENGDYKSEQILEEKEDGHEYENYKEYYNNGFLKTESVLINGDKHGICYNYYENGNVKNVGFFEYDKPVYVQLFYNEDGSPEKIEKWKKGKLISTKATFNARKGYNYKVKKYKD